MCLREIFNYFILSSFSLSYVKEIVDTLFWYDILFPCFDFKCGIKRVKYPLFFSSINVYRLRWVKITDSKYFHKIWGKFHVLSFFTSLYIYISFDWNQKILKTFILITLDKFLNPRNYSGSLNLKIWKRRTLTWLRNVLYPLEQN